MGVTVTTNVKDTYVPINTYTVSGSPAASFDFTSIPSTYTDLVFVINGTKTTSGVPSITVNGDSSSGLYSDTYMAGTGSSAISGYSVNQNSWFGGYSSSSSNPVTMIMSILNYSNTTTYKTMIARYSTPGDQVVADVLSWRNTAAINRVTLSFSNWAVGTTATLYGIKGA